MVAIIDQVATAFDHHHGVHWLDHWNGRSSHSDSPNTALLVTNPWHRPVRSCRVLTVRRWGRKIGR
ncbi:hypothetical protein [Streptomyces lavendofoliae]|uniref:hypothetical protein n=1 Tax=Streptomyces lavendofoliae TaxID=67314 RepID=UPI003D8A3A96